MFYTVYKTTNLLSGKFYIGVHRTTDPNDDYLGSGKLIKLAIERHGRENFSKEVLFIFDNPADAFKKEAEIVTAEFLAENNTYNLKLGGEGGTEFVWVNNGSEESQIHPGDFIPEGWMIGRKPSFVEDASSRMKQYHGRTSGHVWYTNGIQNVRLPVGSQIPDGYRKGRSGFSEATKQKMSAAQKGNQKTKGMFWVTDGNQSLLTNQIPDGWWKGRTMNGVKK
jgi:hypothetical protein